MSRTYWLDLYAGTVREDFLEMGAKTSGFKSGRRKWQNESYRAIISPDTCGGDPVSDSISALKYRP